MFSVDTFSLARVLASKGGAVIIERRGSFADGLLSLSSLPKLVPGNSF